MKKSILRLFFNLILNTSLSLFFSLPCLAQVKPVHLVADSRLKLEFCSHKVEKGEWLLSILRQYGYRDPFTHSIINVVQNYNGHIENFDSLETGDQLLIPVVIKKEDTETDENKHFCDVIKRSKKQSTNYHFGNNTYALQDRGQIYLYSFLSFDLYTGGPSAQRSIASSPQEQPLQSFEAGSELSVSLGGLYDTLEGTKNSSTVFVSELQPLIELQWKQNWTQHWKSFIGLNMIFKNYTNFSNDVTTATNLKTNQGQLFAGAEYSPMASLALRGQFNFGEAIFYAKDANNLYSIEKDQVMKTQLSITQRLVVQKPLQLSALGQFEFVGSGNQGFDGGYNYAGGFELGHKKDSYLLKSQLVYGEGQYDTNTLSFKQKILKLTLTYEFGL